ncbi:MAG: condensation domain-containing protein, partial [Myxococcota bacterium]
RGKIDRDRLRLYDSGSQPATSAYTAPRDEFEQAVATAFSRVLGVDRVGARDDFFALGGHSLLATQVVAALEEATGVRLDLRTVFMATNVAALAGTLRTAATDSQPMRPIPRCQHYPDGPDSGYLSFGQQRLWFVEQLLPGKATYNMPACVRLIGAVDRAAFSHSLGQLIERHEGLRTCFVGDEGQVIQRVVDSAPLALRELDLSGADERDRDALDRIIADEAAEPFDLARAPLLRALLVRVGADEHRLVITMHHIISDGWSVGLLIRELAHLYQARVAGRAAALPALPIRYRDYSAWQRSDCSREGRPEAYAYWSHQLAGAPQHLGLPTDRPRPPRPTSAGATYPISLGADLSRAVVRFAQRTGTTRFMVLLAGWSALLHHHSGNRDVVVVSPVAGRRRPETHGVIGFFVNWLALRTDTGGDPSFRELLERVRDTCLGGLEYQDVPFEGVIEQLRLRRE